MYGLLLFLIKIMYEDWRKRGCFVKDREKNVRNGSVDS